MNARMQFGLQLYELPLPDNKVIIYRFLTSTSIVCVLIIITFGHSCDEVELWNEEIWMKYFVNCLTE